MSPSLAKVVAAAEALSASERQELIDLLLGLDGSVSGAAPAALSEAWKQEVARRSAEYDAGHAEAVSWEAVQARWQARSPSDG
jgi:putative addiction module component (TIGR02574 family)